MCTGTNVVRDAMHGDVCIYGLLPCVYVCGDVRRIPFLRACVCVCSQDPAADRTAPGDRAKGGAAHKKGGRGKAKDSAQEAIDPAPYLRLLQVRHSHTHMPSCAASTGIHTIIRTTSVFYCTHAHYGHAHMHRRLPERQASVSTSQICTLHTVH